MRITLKNDLGEIVRLADALERYADKNQLDSRLVFHLNLALEELVTNIISYAYRDYPKDSPIHLTFSLESDYVEIQVEDYGPAFNPIQAPEPDTTKSVEERKIGGLGIHLVKKMMENLSYRREENRNILILRKSL